ncbi:MAG: DUF262 domain-containing HNH endonuclease family protein [Chloroflexi bacterium]|nr:DUF262 domain-containing HNH endonuclease family protein [Chloroflexota bacterium]
MQQKTFEATELEVRRVFGDDYIFEMPPHQRPYAWETDQVDELLRDLHIAMDNDEDAYFLGSIVLIRNSETAAFQVIDGQQRLTTLTILFCILRELSEDKDATESLDNRVREKGDRYAGSRDRFRLAIRERDDDFFQENVLKGGRLSDFVHGTNVHSTESRKRIFENSKFLWEQLEPESAERRDALAEFIIQRCYLVVVTASDRTSAHRIFSVLNARGLNLDATDILKADILGYVPRVQEVEYTRRWEDIEEELGRDAFRNLFAHLYVIYNKNRNHGELAEAFRVDVLETNELGGARFIDDVLEPYSEVFQIVSKVNHQGDAVSDEINLQLQYLSWLDNEDWIPPVMSFYHQNEDSAALLRFLKDFDRLAYGLFILRMRRDPRISRYRNVLEAIETGTDINADDDGPLALSNLEKRDIVRSLDGTIYQNQTRRFTTPILARLSNAIADPPISEFNKVTVEHVLPQNPAADSEWVKAFSNPDEREEWTHRLANLVLLSHKKNSRARNYDFTKKKTEYFRRHGIPSFALTSQVIDKDEWTPAVLERRQRYLLDVLKRQWRLT